MASAEQKSLMIALLVLVGYGVVMEWGRRRDKHDANEQLRKKADRERSDRVRPDYLRKMEREKWAKQLERKARELRVLTWQATKGAKR